MRLGSEEEAKQIEEQRKNEAEKLLTLLNNAQECAKLRAERGFTLEKLSEDRGITSQDCKKLFTYAKVLYDQGKHKGKLNLYHTNDY